MIKTRIILILIFVVGVLVSGCAEEKQAKIEKITIGSPSVLHSTLIFAADENNLFKQNDVDVHMNLEYLSGKDALQDVIDNKLDIATVTEFALVGKIFDNSNLRILAVIAETDVIEVVARKDRGILSAPDLKGKRIGVTIGTEAHFFLGTFLEINGVSLSDVDIIDLSPDEITPSISTGKVDAVISWTPHILNAKNSLGNTAISWSAQSGQTSSWLLVTRKDVIESKSMEIRNFLNVLLQSENFVGLNNIETKNLLEKHLGLEKSRVEENWPRFTFSVSLPQKLVIVMQDAAQWRINNGLTDSTKIPNYYDYIYLNALDELKPEAVGIIG